MSKISFDDFIKSLDLQTSYPCACVGPENKDDPYCSCVMMIYNTIKDDDKQKLREYWKSNGRLTYQEIAQKQAESKKSKSELIREKRIKLLKEKGLLNEI